MNAKPPQLIGLHALRGLAAVAVLVHHLDVFASKFFGDTVYPPGMALGWFGVDVFFVLSGFIMVFTTRQTPPSGAAVGRFLVQRAGRIYPPYWAGALLAVGLWLLLPHAFAEYWGAEIGTLAFLIPGQSPPFLVPAWTLMFELSFYLVFAALLFLPTQARLAGLGVWCGLMLAGSFALYSNPGPLGGVFLNPLVLEFLAGALIAHLVLGGRRAFAMPALILGGMGLFAGAFVSFRIAGQEMIDFSNEWVRVALVGVPAALVIYGAAAGDMTNKWPSVPLLNALGDRSYALYLAHWPIVIAMAAFMSATFGKGALIQLAFLPAATLASFAAAEILHRLVERPSHEAARTLARRIGALAPGASAR